MNSYKPIGGYFEIETNDFNTIFHDEAIALNSGRNALEYILSISDISLIYIPYYSCDVILQPIKKLGIDYKFYYLDEQFTPKIDSINSNEALLYINYFGILTDKIIDLEKQYSGIIIDNSQAFYSKSSKNNPSFYSPRKFFGLPDGGFAYTKNKSSKEIPNDKSSERFSHLLTRVEEGPENGFADFKINEATLDNIPIKRMSRITDKLMRNINYEKCRKVRNQNFEILHNHLKENNKLTSVIERNSIDGPLVYPFLENDNIELRKKLIENKIFVAQYWPNVSDWLDEPKSFENYLFQNLIPLPIDQRYTIDDMQRILEVINKS